MVANSKRLNWLLIVMTLLFCYFPLCHRIDILSIQLWDESRNVTNAIEMLNNNNWVTRYFENKPDMWELKPPFLIWCQVLAFKIFGYNELAARLPSVFFSCSTLMLLLWFSNKITGKINSGAISCLILVSSIGYIGDHGVRFGDHEAALTFFTTAFILFCYLFFTTKSSKYLGIAFVALFLGWFTKSIVIFMFGPGLFFWAILNKSFITTLKRKDFWIGLLILIASITTYYLIRNADSPDYFREVWMNELLGRYFGYSNNYEYKMDYFYYINNFLHGRYFHFFILFILEIPFVLFDSTLKHRKLLKYLILINSFFLLIISFGTKNYWYDVPFYPIASLFTGIVIVSYFKKFSKNFHRILYSVVIAVIIYPSYSSAIQYSLKPEIHNSENWRSLCYFLKNEDSKYPKNLKIIHNGFYAPLYLYIENLKKKNISVTLLKTPKLEINDTFLITDKFLINQTDSLYDVIEVLKNENCFLNTVKSIKY